MEMENGEIQKEARNMAHVWRVYGKSCKSLTLITSIIQSIYKYFAFNETK